MEYLILALATWRISAILSYEDGPWSVFHNFRLKLEQGSMLQGLFGCVWCLSIWVGSGIWIVYKLWPGMVVIMVPFALSAVAIIIESWVDDAA